LSNFSKSGFKTVKDIWDQNSKIFVNSTEIFNRLRDKRNWIAKYSRIKASFSHELLEYFLLQKSTVYLCGEVFYFLEYYHFL
jgi:hypothetical protein